MTDFPLLAPGRTFVIAEIGVNHNGDPEIARRLIDVARDAGADAVKFQTFKADKLVAASARKARYQMENHAVEESQRDMIRRYELAEGDLRGLHDYCREAGVRFLSTPFDEDSAALLDSLDVAAFKVSSGDLTAVQFLATLAGYGRPIILSSGMADMAECEAALAAIRAVDADLPVAILHCVSLYPAPVELANLRAIPAMRQALGMPVGWSDHTKGTTTALGAVALGARILEKHFTLSRDMEGPDHRASLEPDELAAYIAAVREMDAALGTGKKVPAEAELDTIAAARRSLVLARDVSAGETFGADALMVQRPGTGLLPSRLDEVAGRAAARDLSAGTVLRESDLA